MDFEMQRKNMVGPHTLKMSIILIKRENLNNIFDIQKNYLAKIYSTLFFIYKDFSVHYCRNWIR